MPVLPEILLQEARTRLSENGRIVIPAPIRNFLGFAPGEEIILIVDDGELRLTTSRKRAERAQRLVRRHVPPGVSLAGELIADRRKEATGE
jgi:AbrB family looped-hinge helix DNA binding protein